MHAQRIRVKSERKAMHDSPENVFDVEKRIFVGFNRVSALASRRILLDIRWSIFLKKITEFECWRRQGQFRSTKKPQDFVWTSSANRASVIVGSADEGMRKMQGGHERSKIELRIMWGIYFSEEPRQEVGLRSRLSFPGQNRCGFALSMMIEVIWEQSATASCL